jgi:hypothetical protein
MSSIDGEGGPEPDRAAQLLDGARVGVSLLRLPRVVAGAGTGLGSSAMRHAGHAMQRHLDVLPGGLPHVLETLHYALAYATLDGALITEHVGRRWQARSTVADKASRVALGRTVPLLGVGLSVASAAWSLRRASELQAEGARIGAAIECVHAVTDMAGVVPVMGPLVSVLGDIACICAHWFADE